MLGNLTKVSRGETAAVNSKLWDSTVPSSAEDGYKFTLKMTAIDQIFLRKFS